MIFTLIFISFSLISNNISSNAISVQNSSISKSTFFIPYYNPQLGIRLQYPSNFSNVNDEFDNSIEFYTKFNDNVSASISLSPSFTNRSLDEGIQNLLGSVSENGSKIVHTTMAEQPALKIEYKDGPFNIVKVFAEKYNIIYSFTYYSPQTQFGKPLPSNIQKMIDTLNFTSGPEDFNPYVNYIAGIKLYYPSNWAAYNDPKARCEQSIGFRPHSDNIFYVSDLSIFIFNSIDARPLKDAVKNFIDYNFNYNIKQTTSIYSLNGYPAYIIHYNAAFYDYSIIFVKPTKSTLYELIITDLSNLFPVHLPII